MSGLDWLEDVKWVFVVAYVACTIGVTIGVYWENEKFSKERQHLGWKLLLWSLALDTLFTIIIFGIDGQISKIQRDEIATLEKRLEPRKLTEEQQDALLAAVKPFHGQQYALSVAAGSETVDILCAIYVVLKKAGWILQDLGNSLHVGAACIDERQISVNMLSGIEVWVRADAPANVKEAQSALPKALADDNLEVHPHDGTGVNIASVITNPNTIHLVIGAKL
jgi:hypothetical protein